MTADRLRYRVLPFDGLTSDHLAAWAAIQEADPTLSSPYFRPEFAAAVAAVRPDVRVAVVERTDEPVAFFPFQHGPLGEGKPVGGRLSDYHGLIAKPGVEPRADRLVGACGLRSWAFDHLPASQLAFGAYGRSPMPSHRLDLSRGFAGYLADCGKSSEVKEAHVKQRRTERNIGPLRVEHDCRDRAPFDALIAWKREQYLRTGFTDVFSFDWTVRLLERIWEHRSPAFAGWLSVMWAGDQLAAVHFGMRSHGTLHWWFPAYNVDLAKYSPGSVQLLEVARLAPSLGVRTIDLGKGDERYKAGFANASAVLIEGRVSAAGLAGRADASWQSLRGWLKASPLAAPARASARALRPMRERLSFR